MVEQKGVKEVPVIPDTRTTEQQRKEKVSHLEKTFGGKDKGVQKSPAAPAGHQLATTQPDWWSDVNRWIRDAQRWWYDDMQRMRNSILALAPADEYDLDPTHMFGPMGIFGPGEDLSAVMRKMSRQMQALQQTVDQEMVPVGEKHEIVPEQSRMLDFLKDIYELGDDGKVHFKAQFNVDGFKPDEVKVTTSKNRLNVMARSHKKTATSEQKRELCRTIYLPPSVDQEHLQCHLMNDGVLAVEAPLKGPDYNRLTFDKEHRLGIKPVDTTHEQSQDKSIVLKPTGHMGASVLQDGDHKKLHVEFPVEKGFEAKNICVHPESNEIVVTGNQESIEGEGMHKSIHRKEFRRSYTIPETVDPLSIHAQLVDNTLVIEAPLIHTK